MSETVRTFLEFLTAFLGTLGFALVFRVHYKHLPVAAVGGMLTYLIYKLAVIGGASLLAAAVFSAFFMGLFSEICARILRAPMAVFLLPCAIPIVPGSYLYYTMENLITQNFADFRFYLMNTLEVAIGIAVGTSAATIGVSLFFYCKNKCRKK